MNYYIQGAGFINKGAELMLIAISQQIRLLDPSAIIAADFRCGSFSQRRNLDLFTLTWCSSDKLSSIANIIDFLANILPKSIRHLFRLITRKDVNVVFDASGFAYSDQTWSPYAIRRANEIHRWVKNNAKVILLPQAFGPFTSSKTSKAVSEIITYSELVFVRDKKSLEYLLDLMNQCSNIREAPDFTNLVQGIQFESDNIFAGRPCIIPNAQMIDRTSSEQGKQYISFLVNCFSILVEIGQDPFILIHETKRDLNIAEEVRRILNIKIDIIQVHDPLRLKGLISQSNVVVGSRFHGLVSALSQGVPCIGAGWSHKYECLFEDYNCSSYLLSINASMEEIRSIMNLIIISEESRKAVISNIKSAALYQKRRTHKMWDEIQTVLFNNE